MRKTKIIAILVMTLLIINTGLSVAGTFSNNIKYNNGLSF